MRVTGESASAAAGQASRHEGATVRDAAFDVLRDGA